MSVVKPSGFGQLASGIRSVLMQLRIETIRSTIRSVRSMTNANQRRLFGFTVFTSKKAVLRAWGILFAVCSWTRQYFKRGLDSILISEFDQRRNEMAYEEKQAEGRRVVV